MSSLGNVRIGSRAPDFRCDAVYKGTIEEVTLSSYVNEDKKAWLILLFIPAAFSFVCPTEVIAFQNCLTEFKDRNCDIVFVSVDTKHSLWHWQNVPRQYGGLGQIDIPLLSDATHRMSRDYGVLIEEEGVCLRGMFIIDDETIVQQITLNNLTVGRSVLEALRLLEAFQAVAKHGVLCPVNWKPSDETNDTMATISNMLTESYEDRLANLQKEFGDTLVTDLDEKHNRENEGKGSTGNEERIKNSRQSSSVTTNSGRRSLSALSSRKASASAQVRRESDASKDVASPSETHFRIPTTDGLLHMRARKSSAHSKSSKSEKSPSAPPSAPPSASTTPIPTPSKQESPKLTRQHSQTTTARHSRGHYSAPPTPSHRISISSRNTYESRRGSQVILEFAEPSSTSPGSPHPSSGLPDPQYLTAPLDSPSLSSTPRPSIAEASSPNGGNGNGNEGSPSQTRLQATFEAIKKMSSGLTSPKKTRSGGKNREEVQSPGYFDVVVDAVEI